MRKILVLLSGKPIDAEALAFACRVGSEHGAQVYPIAVIEMRRTLPLDTADLPEMVEGRRWLDAADTQATAAGCRVKSTLLTVRSAGPAVVDEIIERCIDVLIMGIPYEKRFGELELDEAHQYILRHAPCQVWLVREGALPLDGRTCR
ncbi:MAG: universal stress protein [Bacteroidetes bacterium]|nr:universal stress protein [Bacteroidota bacterium]MCL5025539.1 universal stress protein [Chloroflexota bacterium]